MKLKYTMSALNLYTKQTGRTIADIAKDTGLGYSTLNRFAREERLPDIPTLLRICNTLHIRIDNFFIHPDIEQTQVKVYLPEEWGDIIFRPERIEAIRMERNLTKAEVIRRINLLTGSSITLNTYNHLIVGEHAGYPIVLGLMEAMNVDTGYLFEQTTLPDDEDVVVVPRKTLNEMKDYTKHLEDTVRELQLKNKRLEKQALPRYQERMENLDAQKVIQSFLRKMEKTMIELKSWTTEETDTAPSVPYGEITDRTLMVADGDEEV